jgi:hypothetical protein
MHCLRTLLFTSYEYLKNTWWQTSFGVIFGAWIGYFTFLFFMGPYWWPRIYSRMLDHGRNTRYCMKKVMQKVFVFASLKSVIHWSYGRTHHLHWRPSFQLFVCIGLESWLGGCHVFTLSAFHPNMSSTSWLVYIMRERL